MFLIHQPHVDVAPQRRKESGIRAGKLCTGWKPLRVRSRLAKGCKEVI